MTMTDMKDATPGPWTAIDMGMVRNGGGEPSYIHIAGPNGEKICDIFPHAGSNGVGMKAARANAALIVQAAPKPTP